MHILFFTYDTIIPTDSGGKTRALNLIKHAKKGAKISLFSFMREGYDLASLEEIKKIGIEEIEVFPRAAKTSFKNLKTLFQGKESIFKTLYFDEKASHTLFDFVKSRKVDLVHYESFYTGFYISTELEKLGARQVYGSENIEHLLYEDSLKSLNPLLRKFAASQVRKIQDEEREMARLSDVALAVTPKEEEYFKKFARKTFVIPNGINPKEYPYVPREKKDNINLLFVGNFNYFPNRDALKFFFTKIWGQLDRQKVSLILVGRNVEKLGFLPGGKIEKIGYAKKLDEIYNRADIFISPMRFGGGTNFKVLEAMSTGLPVVALKEKIEGINAESGRDLLVAQNALEFAEHLNRLIKNPGLREEIGKNAHELVKKNYSWEGIGENLHKIWYDLVNEKN